MIFGLSIIPVLALAGAGIDLQAVRSERQRMQDALDAATLAVMSRPMPVNLAQANRQLQTYYQANGGVGRVRFTAQIDPNAQQIVGRTEATFSKPTMIMGILGVEKSDLKVSAAAAKPGGNLLRVAFRMKHITGAYDKQISLKGRPVGATSDVELMRIVYNNPNAQPGGNTTISKLVNGTMTPVARMDCTNGSVTSCTTTILSGDGTAEVDLENIENLYMEMTVSASNPIAAAYLWPGMPRTIRTNDPNLSYRLFIGGVQVPLGQTVDLGKSISCDTWSSQDWEDGGNTGFVLPLTSTDVHYDVRGECASQVAGNGARLVE